MVFSKLSQLGLIPVQYSKLNGDPVILCEYRNNRDNSVNQNTLLVLVNKVGNLVAGFAYNVGQCEVVSIWPMNKEEFQKTLLDFEDSENLLSSKRSTDLFKKSYARGINIMTAWKARRSVIK